MKKFVPDLFGGGDPIELKDDKFTAKFEHIATRIPLEIDLVENEFNLLTTKTDVDKSTQQAWLSMWLRKTEMNSQTYRTSDEDINEFFQDYFFDGVFLNGELRSH
mgnify:CR=1 FL=1